MLARLIWLGLIALAFGAGYYMAMPSPEFGQTLAAENERLIEENQKLAARNVQVEQTLDLVKRQVQTDRIAYASLQRTVEEAEQRRTETQSQLEAQRALLEKLKDKLD